METPGPTSGSPPITGTSTAAAAIRWQVGQLLQATVAENVAGKILLSIGNRQVSSETSLALTKGQQLTVQVRSLGDIPLLRITSGPVTPPLIQAIRALIPQQDSMTPLLASLARLAQTAQPPVPPLIRELTRAMVRNFPDTAAVTRPDTLRTAIKQSGLFLESKLAQQVAPDSVKTSNPAPIAAIQKDFKANLLQLIDRLRNWPGSTPTARPAATANPPLPAPPTGSPAPAVPTALRELSLTPPATNLRSDGSPTNPALTRSNSSGTSNPPPTATATATASTVSTDQLRRAVQTGVRMPLASAQPAPTSASLTTPPPPPSTGASPGALSTALPGTVAPPFTGATPAPQAAVQATIDLINRIGNLRTDLMRQSEAALARIQLHQLASQPRDAERGWLEWLFELPVRRGDDIDLWSMRFRREQQEHHEKKQKMQNKWSVQLAFDLPGLGPVQAQVTLQGERVSTRFWAGKETSLPLFRENLQSLQEMFDQVGLEVGELDCVPGPMPSAATAPSLIREKV